MKTNMDMVVVYAYKQQERILYSFGGWIRIKASLLVRSYPSFFCLCLKLSLLAQSSGFKRILHVLEIREDEIWPIKRKWNWTDLSYFVNFASNLASSYVNCQIVGWNLKAAFLLTFFLPYKTSLELTWAKSYELFISFNSHWGILTHCSYW